MPKLTRLAPIAIAAGALAVTPSQAEECSVRSGPGTAVVLELYTSEGCNSCPPADRWVRELAAREDTRNRIVPIALHVDYWDHLGWKDPFARAAYAARQRELAGLGGATFVYTPQIFLNGRDYRGWSNARRFEADAAKVNAAPSRADLKLELKRGGSATAELQVSAALKDPADAADAVLYAALYENGLSRNVTAGENRGVRLQHDRVVREWFGPVALSDGGRIDVNRAVMLPVGTRVSGAVAFVQSRATGEILQGADTSTCP